MSTKNNKDILKELQDSLSEADRYAEISRILKGEAKPVETKEEVKEKETEDFDYVDVDETLIDENQKFNPFEDSDFFEGVENEEDYTLNADEFHNVDVEPIIYGKVDSVTKIDQKEDTESIDDNLATKTEVNDLANDISKLNLIIEGLENSSQISLNKLSEKISKQQKLILNELEFINHRLKLIETDKNTVKVADIDNKEEPIENTEFTEQPEEVVASNVTLKNEPITSNEPDEEIIQQSELAKQDGKTIKPIINKYFSYSQQVKMNGKNYIVVGESNSEDGLVYILEDPETNEAIIVSPSDIEE